MIKGASNWHVWKFKTQILLKAKGANEVYIKNSKPTDEKRLKDWRLNRDHLAQGIIACRVEEIQLQYNILIMSYESAFETWNKSLAIFDKLNEIIRYK